MCMMHWATYEFASLPQKSFWFVNWSPIEVSLLPYQRAKDTGVISWFKSILVEALYSFVGKVFMFFVKMS